ncbi:hypothetical protein D3C73_1118990 [compost metagenome]
MHFRLPVFKNLIRFNRIRRILAVQRGVPAPIGETGVIGCARSGRESIVANRFIMLACDAVHRQIMNFFIVLQQVDQHKRTFRVFGCSMDRHPVLRRNGGDFFLVRRQIDDGTFIFRFIPAHFR